MNLDLIIDNFAGGGGASTGIEAALGRPVDIAINHDAEAVAMHLANHPSTRHYCQSIMAIDPLEATGGRPVALVWFSPDCKHHSKAKGGKPREKNIRDLAKVVPHWAERLRKATRSGIGQPRIIMLENVEEFRQWGPLDADGRPIPERKGEEYDLWIRSLKRQGYKVEWRELRACDYGAPTSRKRLFLIARCDGLPITWPEPTHGKPGSADVLSGRRLPWRTAAECIDWSIACPSIFARKRPLKDTTLRRIAHGTMRYVVNAASPFIVPVTHHGSPDRGIAIGDVLPTVTAAHRGELALVSAGVVPIAHTSNRPTAHDVTEPLRTITTAKGGELAATSATLIMMGYGEREGQAPRVPGLDQPARTVVAGGGKHGLVTVDLAHIEKFSENSRGRPADAPRDTVMSGAPRHAAVQATAIEASFLDRQFGRSIGADADAPAPAITAGGSGKTAAVTAFLSHFYSSNTNGGQGDPTLPAKTVTSGGQHHAVVCAHIEQANGGSRNGNLSGRPASVPLSTVTATGSQQRIVQTTLIDAGALPADAMDRAVQVAAFLVKYYGNEEDGHGLTAPIGTVTTKDRFAVVTVTIDARTYVIVDIGMRMLTPRELARAQGFPDSYILDPVVDGRPLTKTAQIRMIGNSVCPAMSEALVRANMPAAMEERAAA